jgi:hypothetical protein
MRNLTSSFAAMAMAGITMTVGAQAAPVPRAVQPKIMVIPFTKDGEDIRKVLESDFNRRVAITTVKQGFDDRKFSTVDFLAVVREMPNDAVVHLTSQSDVRSAIVEQSRCDIYVVVEIDATKTGNLQNVSMILTAYLAGNGTSLSNKVAHAGPYDLSVPLDRIVQRATEDKLEPFLATMQQKFDDFVVGGVPIRVQVTVAEGSATKLSSLVGPKKEDLSLLLDSWFEKAAVGGVYHVAGSTDLLMNVDELRIPLFDPTTHNTYNANRLALDLGRYLSSLGVQTNRTVRGGVVNVEIR